MAWLRICRPGSVIGPQQPFLIDRQQFCWNLKRRSVSPVKYRTKTGDISTRVTTSPRLAPKQSPTTSATPVPRLSRSPRTPTTAFDETAINAEGKSQGDRLLSRKAHQQHQGTSNVIIPPSIPASATRTQYTSATTPIKQLKVSTKRVPAIMARTSATRTLHPIATSNNNHAGPASSSTTLSSSKKSSNGNNIPVGGS